MSFDFCLTALSAFFRSHCCTAVRESTAQHLHQVFDTIGASYILTAGRILTEHFITAVAKMSLDAAPTVR